MPIARTARSTPEQKKPVASGRVALRAIQLLGRWTRLSRGHIALGAGCLCATSLGSVQPAEYDQQIVEFLIGKHPEFASIEARRLDKLLAAVARGGAGHAPRACAALLDDVERSLDSFGVLHGSESRGI